MNQHVNINARKGDWMLTFSGQDFWPLDPKEGEIHIEDIAHALAFQCRYGGHSKAVYSVAQHSVLVSLALPDLPANVNASRYESRRSLDRNRTETKI